MLKFVFLNISFTKKNPRSIEFSFPLLLSFTYLKLLYYILQSILFFHIVNTYLYIIIKIPYIFHLQPEIEFCFIFLTCQEKIYKSQLSVTRFLQQQNCTFPPFMHSSVQKRGINNDSLKQKS